MSIQNTRTRSDLAARRGEILAELFFEELNPVFVSRPTTKDVGYDLLVAFANDKEGINTFAVQVKSTEQQLKLHFPIPRTVFNRIAHSNLPSLLLVADVKRNRLYYAWLGPNESKSPSNTVLVPIVEINETTKHELKRQLQRAKSGLATAG